jgi:hypothetical protein
MKKQNPVRDTVTHFVRSTGGRRNKKNSTESKFIRFFNDLENRGPFTPNSLFEIWTKKICKDMNRDGTWGEDSKGVSFEFVAEYIYRLQVLFQKSNKEYAPRIHTEGNYSWKNCKFTPEGFAFRMIYLKIRVWGLRTKQFRLRKWRKMDPWVNLHHQAVIWPMDFTLKYRSEKKTFRYVVTLFGAKKIVKEIYVGTIHTKTIDLRFK